MVAILLHSNSSIIVLIINYCVVNIPKALLGMVEEVSPVVIPQQERRHKRLLWTIEEHRLIIFMYKFILMHTHTHTHTLFSQILKIYGT